MRQRPLYVRHDGQVPQDVVEIACWTDDVVRFFPAGGGFECSMSPDEFDRLHRRVADAEYSSVPWRAATFDIDRMFGDLPGFTTGRRWNGWACPVFPRASCEALIARLPCARFDPASEALLVPREDAGPGDEAEEVYLPQTILFDGQPLRVWAIGTDSWTWEETSPAQGVEND
jgi:hypothetical protein